MIENYLNLIKVPVLHKVPVLYKVPVFLKRKYTVYPVPPLFTFLIVPNMNELDEWGDPGHLG